MGWKIDDIVSPAFGKLAKQFECSICFSIWDDAVETPCCENHFCRACVSPCAACPMCRLPLGELRPCSKAVLRMLNSVEVRCPYHAAAGAGGGAAESLATDGREGAAAAVEGEGAGAAEEGEGAAAEPPAKRARHAGCEWEGSYGDFLATHLGVCQYHPVPCPHQCGATVARKDLAEHAAACERNFDKCSICGALLKQGEMPGHRKEAAELHAQLLEEQLRAERAQAKTLDQVLQSVEALGEQVTRLANQQNQQGINLKAALQQHVTKKTKELGDDIKAELKRQVGQQAVWEIPEASQLRERYHPGRRISSATFQFWSEDFSISFYPSGQAKKPNKPVIFLRGNASLRMRVKWTFNDSASHTGEWTDDKGSQVPEADLFDTVGPDDVLKIHVEVIDSAARVQSKAAE